MKKIAIFGNAGGGKSALARNLAELTRIPLYVVDMMQFRAGGVVVPHDEFLKTHGELLRTDAWIIDGFGGAKCAWERFAAADTLIHVDLPLWKHFLWVTKRLIKGLFVAPPGWPEGSPVLSSSISSYRVLWPCHQHLTPKYRELVSTARQHKRVHHLRSAAEINAFLDEVRSTVGVTIRRAEAADAAAVCDAVSRSITGLLAAEHKNDAATLASWLKDKTVQNASSWISAQDRYCVVAVARQRVCGFGMIKKTGEIGLLYVAPEARFQGASKRMLEALERQAREWGLESIRATSSLTAREFYLRRGFAPAGGPVKGFGITKGYPVSKSLAPR